MPPLGPTQVQALVDAVPHWHHIMQFPHGVVTPGAYDPREMFSFLKLPDLGGKRVLDVGTRDGFFAFECERLGAEVVAVDYASMDLTGFGAAKRILGSEVEYRQANVYDLSVDDLGTFDVVLFLGVLYHLRHPLLALDRLRPLCRSLLIVESLVCDTKLFTGFESGAALAELAPGLVDIPLAEFLPVGRFHSDSTNKWVPNVACLRALLADAQFDPGPAHTWGDRALIPACPIEDATTQRRADLDRGLQQ